MPINPSPKTRTWSRFRRKAAPGGASGAGGGGGSFWSDAYRTRRGPSPYELVEAFKSVLFFCSRFNQKGVCATPLRLYLSTKGGQEKAKSYLGARGVGRWKGQWLRRRDYLVKALAGAEDLEEVTGEHPILHALQEVNPFLDPVQLLSHAVASLDIIGTAYWQPTLATVGGRTYPEEIWALPAQVIWAVPDGTSLVPRGYQYFDRMYLPGELIRFANPSLRNPYMDGLSPARAAIQYARLEDEFVSDQDAMNSNGPRPKVLVTTKDAQGSIGDPERKRLRQEFNAVGARGRLGGIVIADGNLDVKPITYQNLDPGATVFSRYALERIANAMDTPMAFLTPETNLANMQAARDWHAENAVEPRCKGIASTLTRFFHALDATGRMGWRRLFFAFDPVVEEDKKAAADQHKTYVAMGVINRDAVAAEIGHDPLPDGQGQAYTVEGPVASLDSVINPPEPPPAAAPFGGEAPPKNGEEKPPTKSLEGDDRRPFAGPATKFNPNHTSDGRFGAGHGGSGGGGAGTDDEAARIARADAMADELADHPDPAAELARRADPPPPEGWEADARGRHEDLLKDQASERRDLDKEHARDLRGHDREQAAESREFEREQGHDADDRGRFTSEQAESRESFLSNQKDERDSLLSNQRDERHDLTSGFALELIEEGHAVKSVRPFAVKDQADRGAEAGDENQDDDGEGHGEENTYNLPEGTPIRRELRRWIERQFREVLGTLPTIGVPVPGAIRDLAHWDDRMAAAMTPILSAYWDESGKRTMARLGLDPDEWRVTNPHLEGKIRGAAYDFCHATNASTSKRLDDALAELHEQFVQGQVAEGETLDQLTRRVNSVFENLGEGHSRLIAASEASRAVHAAQLEADAQSGVVAGTQLLLSGDACPLCRRIFDECRQVPLGQAFAVIGEHPVYAQVRHPPLHPACQCGTVEVMLPAYGGPEAPEWGRTLVQPQKGLGD